MKITKTIIIIFIGSFLIQYFLMPPIMVNDRKYITNNIGKVYLSFIMSLFTILLEVMMHDYKYHVLSLNFYIFIIAALILFIYLYKKQIAINNKQYLQSMIEDYSMALLKSKEILKKTDDYNIVKIAKKIIQTQQDDIKNMTNYILKI